MSLAAGPDADVVVIVNEHAGGRAMSDIFRRVEHRLRDIVGPHQVRFTDHKGHATELSRAAIAEGARTILVAGGDGTVSEAAGGFFDPEGVKTAPEGVTLGVLAGGTGGDFRKSLRLRDMDAALDAIEAGATRDIDVGRVRFRGIGGRDKVRIFVNIASFGLSGQVVANVGRYGALPGPLAYVAATMQSLVRWRNPMVRLQIDGERDAELPITTVAIANGRFFGGGMKIAPDAQLDDGQLAVTILSDLTRMEILGLSRTVYDGGHIYDTKTIVWSGKTIEATSRERVALDIDGEPIGHLPATFEVLPGALRIIAATA